METTKQECISHSLSPSRCGTAECFAHAKGDRRKSCGQAAPTRSVPEGLTDTLRVSSYGQAAPTRSVREALTLKFKIQNSKFKIN